jgi:hypothetical protein
MLGSIFLALEGASSVIAINTLKLIVHLKIVLIAFVKNVVIWAAPSLAKMLQIVQIAMAIILSMIRGVLISYMSRRFSGFPQHKLC